MTRRQQSQKKPKTNSITTGDNLAVHIKHVYKKYILHHEKPTLTDFIQNKNTESFYALTGISLNIKKGESVGIAGRNGSGKTTLLKIIAGIASPSAGSISAAGKIVSLIDLDAGFHADLSGIQNIMLNGMLLGMTKKEIQEKTESIIRFADLGNFIDTPMYVYSLGMKLRLGFAIALHSDPDILLMDEGFSVGDIFFKEKNLFTIKKMFNKNKTIIVVSHNIDIINELCSRMVVLDKGNIIYDGKTLSPRQYKNTLLRSSHTT